MFSSFINDKRVQAGLRHVAEGAAATAIAVATRVSPARLANVWSVAPLSLSTVGGVLVINGIHKVAVLLLRKYSAVIAKHTEEGHKRVAFQALTLALSGAALGGAFVVVAPHLGLAALTVKQVATLVGLTALGNVTTFGFKYLFIDPIPKP